MKTFLLVLAACTPPVSPRPTPMPKVAEPAPPPAPADAAVPDAPAGPRTVDVVDHDFGIDAPDPYRWMEGEQNPERDAWLKAQGERAAARLHPGDLLDRIRKYGMSVTAVFDVEIAGGHRFFKELAAGEQLAKLYADDHHLLVDPAAITIEGSHASLHAYSASPDGKLVAYVISTGGGEIGTLHVMDVATGKDLPDRIDRIWGEGSASWLPDGKSFFYTQITAKPGDDPLQNQVAKLHVLGKSDDVQILPAAAMQLRPEEWPGLWAPPGSGYVMAFVGGAHSEQRIAFAKLAQLDRTGAGKTPWRAFADYADGIEAALIHGDRIYYISYAGAPNRRILSAPLADPKATRIELAEDHEIPLVGMYAGRDALYVLRRKEGRAQLLRWPWHGTPEELHLPHDGWIPDVATDMLRDGITFQIETWTAPGEYYAYRAHAIAPIGLASSMSEHTDIAAEELLAHAADGTQVPLTILHGREAKQPGATILGAYGAYGVSQSPGFNATRWAWMEHSGNIAICHVRGGGERGRAWQDAGSREHKMNGVHDFEACAEYLIEHGYTDAHHLAAEGGSMGGLLIGRVITDRPDLFAAAHIAVGFVNPLRLAVAENGPNQKAELGDPATEAGYRALYDMDPYQHVTRAKYPATIFTVGLHDHRVAPWMTAKMAARMQALSSSKILVRIDPDAGHGIGSTRDQAFAERADVWSFFLAAFDAH